MLLFFVRLSHSCIYELLLFLPFTPVLIFRCSALRGHYQGWADEASVNSHTDTSGMTRSNPSVSRVAILCRFWQTPVPDSVETFIRACTVSYGKAKLVLKHNKHYIESPFPEVLRELLKNATVNNRFTCVLSVS